jgi:serine/threonine protein kinase
MTTDVLPQERLQAGRRHVNAMFAAAAASTGSSSNSSNGITDQSSTFPSFTLNQLTLGKVLGKGGFCTVSEVRAFAVNNSHDATEPASDEASSSVGDVKEEDDENDNDVFGSGISRQQQQSESRRFIAKHCLRESSSGKNGGGGNVGDARYAIKELSVETKQNAELFLQGLIDMAVETRFLSDLTEHPNIIKMRATCQTSDGSPFSAPQQYFILMDRLYDTLEKRLQSWKKQSDRLVSLRFVKDRHGNKAAALYEERIVAAFDLSAALSYLHDRQIIYRYAAFLIIALLEN